MSELSGCDTRLVPTHIDASAPLMKAVEAEQSAHELGAILQTTFEAMDQGIIMVGRDQQIEVINDRAKALLALPDHLARRGTPFADVLRHQDAIGEFSNLPMAERARLPIWSDEASAEPYTRKRPNGTVLEIRTAQMGGGGFVRTYTDVTLRHAREAALLASEERYRLLADNTTDVVIWSHLDFTRRYVSPAAKALFGFEPEELIGTSPMRFVHPDDAETLAAVLDDLAQGGREKAITRQRYRCKDGSYLWIEVSFSLVCDPATKAATGYVAAIRDISARKVSEDELRRSEERLAMALGSGGDGVWDYDLTSDHTNLSGRWWLVLGYAEHEIEPNFAGWHRLTHPEDADRVLTMFQEHLVEGMPPIEIEYRMRCKSGAYVWTLARGEVVERAADGTAIRMVGTHMDITRRKEAEQAIAHLAHHDVLTGLPNRALFLQRLQQQISEVERHGGCFAVLACDLDRFKAVNDAFGHAAGDALLGEITKRLKAVIRTEDTVARLGGDEFSIVLGHIAGQDDAYLAAERVIAAVGSPVSVFGRSVQVGMSIGIVVGLDDGRHADELCRRADIAMYVAKASGRNTYRAYNASMEAVLVGRAKLEDDLQDAVKRGGFVLCYQPSFALKTGEVSSFEALLRWRHPTRGPISPGEFIPMAEQTGLMARLGEWALREACREAATWPGTPRVAVNISWVQFRHSGLEQCVISALSTSGLEPDRLILEVTEEVLIQDADAVFASLLRLRGLGVRIALDNFGIGFSSLNHLRRFPFSAIKLHQSLVRDLGMPETAAMARAIVGLRSSPDVEVVAEGVETRDELDQVRAVGCTAVQGFLFSKPLLAEQAARLAGAGDTRRAA